MKLAFYSLLTLAGVLATGAGWVWILDLRPILESTGFSLSQWLFFYGVWGVLSGLSAGFLSRDISIWSTDTRILETTDYGEPIYQKVLELANAKDLKWMPQVGIYPSTRVNIFSAGPYPARSVISVSEGFLKEDPMVQSAFLEAELDKIARWETSLIVFCHGITHGFVLYIARMLAFLLGTSFRQTEGSSSSTYPEILVSGFATIFLTFWGSIVVFLLARRRNLKGYQVVVDRSGPSAIRLLKKKEGEEAYDLFTMFLKVSFPAR